MEIRQKFGSLNPYTFANTYTFANPYIFGSPDTLDNPYTFANAYTLTNPYTFANLYIFTHIGDFLRNWPFANYRQICPTGGPHARLKLAEVYTNLPQKPMI